MKCPKFLLVRQKFYQSIYNSNFAIKVLLIYLLKFMIFMCLMFIDLFIQYIQFIKIIVR